MRSRRISQAKLRGTGGPIAVAAAVCATYVLVFPPLFEIFSVTTAIATFVPVVIVGWSCGARWGALAGVLTIPVNALAFGRVGMTYADEPLRSGLIPGTIGWTAVGYLVGSARDLARRFSDQATLLRSALAERAHIEEALRVQRDRYEMLLDAQSALGEAAIFGRGERIEWVNTALLALTGYTAERLLALPSVYDLVAPEDRSALRDSLRRRTGVMPTVNVLRADGGTFPAEIAVREIRLEGADRGFVVLARNVTERVEVERALRRSAQDDALTGLANRGHLERRLTDMLSVDGAIVAVLLLDLDGFKAVNDRYGHAAGDEVLRIVARRLLGQIRDGDVVGRLGGDEFVILAPDATREGGEVIASRVRNTLARPLRVGDIGCAVGASVGIAVAPADGITAEALLGKADQAMYLSKRAAAR